MAWRETNIMDERIRFIVEHRSRQESMTALCARYGISRVTGYKWLGRYAAEGPPGLVDRSRAPHAHGRATDAALVEHILAFKEARPTWGPKKILACLRARHPDRPWPVTSTLGEILKRHGLVGARRRRGHAVGTGALTLPEAPNQVWTADHKGWFRTRDGVRCEPLTVLDGHSRFALALAATSSTAGAQAWPVFEGLFARFGLPEVLRTDNGSPFASTGVTGLTELAVRFVKLGIRLERIAPGRPTQNGAHERFHGTLLPLERAPAASLAEQQATFEAFRREYNEERPHEALGQVPPASRYEPSPRALPSRVPDPSYPAQAAVRRVRSNGEIKWGGRLIYVSEALVGEPVAAQERADGRFELRFYAHCLGIIDPHQGRLRRPPPTPPPDAAPAAAPAASEPEL